MELRHLRYFLAVAEELHFARAAARLGIEQSPLSRQIRDLEADLKVPLFERTRRTTILTEAGRRFETDARRILADVDVSTRAVRAFANGGQPIRLGLAEWVGGPVISRLMRLCRDAEPRIDLVLTESGSTDLVSSLLAGTLDAILGPARSSAENLESKLAWTEGLVVAVPSDLTVNPKIAWWKAFSSQPWILPSSLALPGCAQQTEMLLGERSLTLRANKTFTCPGVLAGLVASGSGVALLARSLVPSLTEISFHPVGDPKTVMTTWLTVRRGAVSPLTGPLEHVIRMAAAETQGQGVG